MKLTKETENMGLPDYIKFGLELEVENLNQSKIQSALKSKTSFGKWKTEADQSLTDGGTECISPVLEESPTKSVWNEVEEVCNEIKKYPNDELREPYTDHTCGGHVHFDSTIFRKNPEVMKNFLRIWAESEELVYKMCNDVNDPIRPSALQPSNVTMKDIGKTITKNPLPEMKVSSLKDVLNYVRQTGKNTYQNLNSANRKLNVVLSNASVSRNGMASPRSAKIMQDIESGRLHVSTNPISKVFRNVKSNVLGRAKLDPGRYNGLNLSNLGRTDTNTVEFRISNGSIDPRVIKENVFLYSSIIKTAVDMTKEPEKMEGKLAEFYKRDVTEEEKTDAFLNLIMDDPEDRNVFKTRWESVKDAPVFTQSKSSSKFAETFKRDELKEYGMKADPSKISEVFQSIINLKNRTLGKLNPMEEKIASKTETPLQKQEQKREEDFDGR